MSEKYGNKYRIPSARLQTWDYSWAGAYFITICTQDRLHFLGEINDHKMLLSHAGVIADICWQEIKNHATNVSLDAYVIMPNHVHGIIILEGDDPTSDSTTNDPAIIQSNGDNHHIVETRHALSLQPNQSNQSNQLNQSNQPNKLPVTPGQQRFQNQGKNTISSIVGSYKAAVTRHANRLQIPFGWQTRFHDHIIRDKAGYERIAEYILNNVATWENDKFYQSPL